MEALSHPDERQDPILIYGIILMSTFFRLWFVKVWARIN
jgi:hypothetical protein